VLLDRCGRVVQCVRDLREMARPQEAGNGAVGAGVLRAGEGEPLLVELWSLLRSSCDLDRFCTLNLPAPDAQPATATATTATTTTATTVATATPAGGAQTQTNTDAASAAAAGTEGNVQPAFLLIDMPFRLCCRCAQHFDPSLLRPSPALLSFNCDIHSVVEFGIAPPHTLPLLEAERGHFLGTDMQIPHLLFLRRMLLDRALIQLGNLGPRGQGPGQGQGRGRGVREFQARVDAAARTVMVYEDPRYYPPNSIL
jgi:hypothetical protein